ncbi:ATP synthase epsilon chain [Labilithrix luteola]|uniref:ATP synthase epsilon chain n=1 Tax=Labilithrix luteola TaxID=1391654 RepID=A0A0K1Q857_9BACT|nr:ATP synthase F1 subunit epsilon [Labilithrix luteola]AKV01837.1 ATP synthase epsilon chain [Labilithrix luteola]
MADNKIDLEIVTPKGKALTASVDEVTAPSVQGEFGVLPGHLPIVAALRTGLVTYRQGNDTKTCAVGAGFAEAGQNKLLILAEDYADKQTLDRVVVLKEFQEVDAKLDKVLGQVVESTPELEAETKQLIERQNWLATLLELSGDPPAATMRPFEEWGPPTPPMVEEEEGKPEGLNIPGSP